MGDNDIDLEPNEFIDEFRGAFDLAIFPPIIDLNRLILNPAEVVQTLNKCGGPRLGGGLTVRTQKADGRPSGRLLRMHCERPRRCRATEQHDELATLHVPPER